MRGSKLAAAIAAVCLCFSWSASAESPRGTDDDRTKLHVTGSGSVEASPDLITATLTVRTEAGNAARAQTGTNDMTHKAMTMTQGVSGVSASAGAYSVSQNSSGNNNPRNWEARQTLSVKSKNPETLLSLVGRLQSAGLLLEGLDWSLSDDHRKALMRDAEKQAVQDMLHRATGIASELSMKVASIADVTVDESMIPHPMMFMARAAAAPMSTPDTQKVTAMVRATLLLK
ncbi:SIMPL domain-containing protein [Acetobacter fallax]|uniref:DUF541 domain-containing protein n=1 Tax=Acetobacter fallax TaxID=1737473 RepID=A0ABX0K7B6_9PROT|nr:SIMPL domain-containing protein [Acetobacter fallax]NHO32287.1 DUF541 domain-containing protein [Acetobacter fallax]NHO35847.1 DUF541 domain-containing protein [Acetobacter fallax]